VVPRGAGVALRWTRPGFFVPDRRHVPHRLLDLGLSPAAMLASEWGFGIVGGSLAVLTIGAPVVGLACGLVCFGFVVLVARELYPETRVWERLARVGRRSKPVRSGPVAPTAAVVEGED